MELPVLGIGVCCTLYQYLLLSFPYDCKATNPMLHFNICLCHLENINHSSGVLVMSSSPFDVLAGEDTTVGVFITK